MSTISPTKPCPADAVADALATRPDSTAAEVAEAAGVGQSTAGKHLVTLEREGRARRTAGGRDGGRRLADRWTAVGTETVRALAEDSVPGDEPAAAATPRARRRPSAGKARRTDASEPANPAAAGSGRLGKGALRTLVYDYLVAHSGDPDGEGLSPTAVAKGLGGKSSGAVGNALIRLEEEGKVTLVKAAPRRYRPTAG
jgi:DNA-binding transcriptional ArsR family regulator